MHYIRTCPKQVFAEIKNAPTLGYHWFTRITKFRGSGGEPYAMAVRGLLQDH
jgi:hypothetical protein